jgi:hypothetical protein
VLSLVIAAFIAIERTLHKLRDRLPTPPIERE